MDYNLSLDRFGCKNLQNNLFHQLQTKNCTHRITVIAAKSKTTTHEQAERPKKPKLGHQYIHLLPKQTTKVSKETEKPNIWTSICSFSL